jgi:aspartyl-tRNA(Asn)/glutamyl-tRNA(Gln) amidotransferase subunit A
MTLELPRTIAELRERYVRHDLSPVEVTRTLLDQAARSQPRLNAFITITNEQAIAQAQRAEKRVMKGETAPLLGVPISLKDLIDQRGVATTAGSGLFREHIAARDALVAKRLFSAGAISLGKNNLHEFAFGVTSNNPHFGAVHNPWDPGHIPGGSSGGSGAAVAAGIGPVSMGSDTGGSIRIPAALCGVVGLKPTYGRVPKSHVFPLSVSLDHVGPLSASVADSAIVLQVIAGHAANDPTTSHRTVSDYVGEIGQPVHGLRIAVIRQHVRAAQPEVAAAVSKALDLLGDLGAKLIEVDWPELETIHDAQVAILYAESWAVHKDRVESQPQTYGADLRRRWTAISDDQLRAARATRQRARASVTELLLHYDALVGPTVPIAAPPLDVAPEIRLDLTRFTEPYNLTGLPAISVPCGFTAGGLPIGLQIGARPFNEAGAVRVAHAYEQATDWHLRRPPVAW